jgi:O-antigen/teichoic acid export membrane protein
MANETVVTPTVEVTPQPRRARSLTSHASLNAVASLVDYAARGVVSLLVTPVLVSSLGRSLFGVWEMLNRLIGYMSATDGRPTEALRLVIATKLGADEATKRRYVGATLFVWLCTLPIVALVGAGLAWIAPMITRVPDAQRGAVHLACALLVGGFLAGTLASVPESVLRGSNLGYKRMGLQTGLSIIAGVLAVAAVSMGLGITGLAGAYLVRALLTGLCFWLLVRTYIAWFGVNRPVKKEVTGLLKMSVWLTVGDAIAKLLLASDVLILGFVVSSAVVTTYTLTAFAARTALGIHVYTASAAMPGLGALIGRGELPRAASARADLLTLTWLFAVTVGTVVLLWNRSFVGLWVGPQHYAGLWIDMLIVVATVQSAFIRTDSYIIDAALQPRARTTVGAIAAVVTIATGIVLTKVWGLPGLCLSIILGRAAQSIAYPVLAHKHLGKNRTYAPRDGIRLGLVGLAMLGGAAFMGQRLTAPGWLAFAAGVAGSIAVVGALALFAGPSTPARRAVIRRFAALRPGRGAP